MGGSVDGKLVMLISMKFGARVECVAGNNQRRRVGVAATWEGDSPSIGSVEAKESSEGL